MPLKESVQMTLRNVRSRIGKETSRLERVLIPQISGLPRLVLNGVSAGAEARRATAGLRPQPQPSRKAFGKK